MGESLLLLVFHESPRRSGVHVVAERCRWLNAQPTPQLQLPPQQLKEKES
jgi:hypothetical protein